MFWGGFLGVVLCVEKVPRISQGKEKRVVCWVVPSWPAQPEEVGRSWLKQLMQKQQAVKKHTTECLCVCERESSPRKKEAKGEGPLKAN